VGEKSWGVNFWLTAHAEWAARTAGRCPRPTHKTNTAKQGETTCTGKLKTTFNPGFNASSGCQPEFCARKSAGMAAIS
jgi:hypothetical protein